MAESMRVALAIEKSLSERHTDAKRRWEAREAGLDLAYVIELNVKLQRIRQNIARMRFAGL